MIYDIWSVRQNGDERALVCALPQPERPVGDVIKYLGSTDAIDNMSRVMERERNKVYPDLHPLQKGSIERAVFEKFGCVSLDKERSWEYWAKRYLDEIRREFKRRRKKFLTPKHQFVTERQILLTLWRI